MHTDRDNSAVGKMKNTYEVMNKNILMEKYAVARSLVEDIKIIDLQ